VLWVNQFSVLPADGGGTRHFELGRELVRRGWRVTLFASDFHMHRRTYTRRSDPNDKQPVVEVVDGVEVHWLWAAPYYRNDWRRGWNWLTFAQSVKRAGTTGPKADVVIGSSPQLFAARAGESVARARQSRFMFEVRDLWPESLVAAGGNKGALYRVLDLIASRLYARAERIIVLAKGTGAYLTAKGIAAEKMFYLPNGVDVGLIAPPAADRSHGERFTLIYAGAHGPANGLDAVLDAADQLRHDVGIRFVLVGDGPAKAALRAAANARQLSNIEFHDVVPKPTLASMLQDADAGLMLLRDAPLFSFAVSPNKLFDYTAAALPVVCNVPGEVAAMVSESGAGVQAVGSSGTALAAAVRALRARPEGDRLEMGASGRRWVEREHGREVLGARLDQFLREFVV